MAAECKVTGMKWVLIIAGLISLIYWGVLLVFTTPALTGAFGAPFPAEPIYVRIIGMYSVVFGLLYFMASRDPVKHRIVVDIGIIRYVLFLIFYLVTMFITKETTGGFAWWIALILSVIFLILFILCRPKAAKA